MIAQVSPFAFDNVGWKYYIVFAICGFSNALYFWVRSIFLEQPWIPGSRKAVPQAFLPETRGIPLEELDAYFDSVPLFVPGSGVYVPDAKTREEELRQGIVVVPEGAEPSPVDEKEKANIEHVA